MLFKSYIAILLLVLVEACSAPGEFRHIGVILWSDDLPAYRQALKGIMDGLRDNGYREGLNIKIDLRNAHGSDAEAEKIVGDFVGEKVDLMVAIGSAACLAAKEGTKERVPIVFSVVTSPREAGIIKEWESSGNNLTGVSIEIPADSYYDKLKKILPRAGRVGIFHTEKYATVLAAMNRAEAAAPGYGLKPILVELGSDAPAENLEKILKAQGVGLDAAYVIGDPVLYSEEVAKKIIPVFKKFKIPVILISENYLKYGALFALNGDFYKIGRQTVPHILKVFDGVKPADIPSERPYDVRFTINKQTADDLHIPLKWNVLIEADSITE